MGRLRTAAAAVALALAGAAAGSAAPADPSLNHILPPPAGQAYFGFTFRLWDTRDPAWGDTRPFDARIRDAIDNELAGKRPTFLTVWAPWQYADRPGKPLVPFAARLADVGKVEGVAHAGFLYLDWNLAGTTAANGGITVADVAAGRLDDYIRGYAGALESYGRPVLVRLFNGEFNGSWWYGVSPRANPSLTTADFVAAWRRVVRIFRVAGARNVSWAWTPAAFPRRPVPWADADLGAYYPGDDYVDWAGADIYDSQRVGDLDAAYRFAAAHGKPFLVAEWAIRHRSSRLSPPGQRAWIASMFDYFERHPGVRAINYFDYDNRPGHAPWNPARAVYLDRGAVSYQARTNDYDHRLLADSGAGFRRTFARRIGSPRYVSGALAGP